MSSVYNIHRMKRRDDKFAVDQRGMVSFMVVLIMMLVITLIVLGFAQVARRNQREALDRQESTQAYYAAESGVNDATNTIRATVASGGSVTPQTNCTGSTYFNAANAVLNPPDNSVAYTCALVDATPKSLKYDDISQSTSTLVPIQTVNPLSSLSFTWTKTTGTATGNCTGQAQYYFPASTAWSCGFGILRVDLVQVTSPAITSAAQLAGQTTTLYLTPQGAAHNGTIYSTGGVVSFGDPTQNAYYGTGCDAAPGTACAGAPVCNTNCAVSFGLAPAAATQYYARITTLYKAAGSVTITGKEAGGVPAKFLNSQVVVDVTGKAQDVLRRIQVRVGIGVGGNNSTLPLNALTGSNGICKQFSIAPGDSAGTAADPNCL